MAATLPHRDARCSIMAPAPGDNPLCVRWHAASREVFDAIMRSWRGEIGCHRDVRFDEDRRHWWVPAHREDALYRWAHSTFDADAIEWFQVPNRTERDPRDRRQRHEQAPPPRRDRAKTKKKQQQQQAAPRRTVTEREEAYATLWLTPGAPPEVVAAAYRALSKRCHPDVGGEPAAMVRLNEAYTLLQG